eukprot:1485125-Pleurochrysis_carterae.AAC.2
MKKKSTWGENWRGAEIEKGAREAEAMKKDGQKRKGCYESRVVAVKERRNQATAMSAVMGET